jgi:hypothetical protein
MAYKTDDTEDRTCEQLGRVFHQYLKRNMKVYMECLCIDEERLCLQTENWEQNYHGSSNDIGIIVVALSTSLLKKCGII